MNRERESGSLLIEVMIAVALLAVGILGFCTSFMSNARASSDVDEQDQVRVALENVTETLRSVPFSQAYATYQGAVLEVPNLEGYSTGYGSATASVFFYVNELSLPMGFGPVVDIDGIVGLTTADCSTTYKLLPTQIVLTYGTRNGPVTRSVLLVLGDT